MPLSYKNRFQRKTMLICCISLYIIMVNIAKAESLKTITGVGSSFAAPLYQAWASEVTKETHIQLNYQALGSSAGQNQVLAKTVHFGASDIPMTEQKRKNSNLMQFPTAMGGIVIVVHIPGIQSNQLQLTGSVLADIYSGKITKWNDPAIIALNKNQNLPDIDIAPIHRADGSGTTAVFTNYLSEQSADWKTNYGSNTSIDWPTGMGGKGNSSVASIVKNVEGSIGYIEYAYMLQSHLDAVKLKNKIGQFVAATPITFQNAANAANWDYDKGFNTNLIDVSGDQVWPIISATYVLVPIQEERTKDVIQFFNWGIQNGDKITIQLHYVSLPDSVKKKIISLWKDSNLTGQ